MSFNLEQKLRQTITVWSTTPDGYGGWTFSTGITVKGRWEERSEIFTGRVTGKEEVSRAVIFLDRDIDVDDWVALGDYTGTANPTTLPQIAFPVRDFSSIPDLRNLVRIRKAVI